jgi:hypothetical protein
MAWWGIASGTGGVYVESMGGRIERGMSLTSRSLALIGRRPRLLVLPLLSMLSTSAAAVALLGPWALDAIAHHSRWQIFVDSAALAYPSVFLSTFFGVGFVLMADAAFDGRDLSVVEAMKGSVDRLPAIAAWALVTTLVGVALRAIEQLPGAGGVAGRIVSWVADTAWSLATLFVVPALAVEGAGPIAAARRSASVIRSRWGESVVGSFAIGSAAAVAMASVAALGVAGWAVRAASPVAGDGMMALAIAAAVLIAVVSSAASQAFRLAVFRYAADGQLVGPYTESELESSFRDRPGSRWGR